RPRDDAAGGGETGYPVLREPAAADAGAAAARTGVQPGAGRYITTAASDAGREDVAAPRASRDLLLERDHHERRRAAARRPQARTAAGAGSDRRITDGRRRALSRHIQ